MVSFLKRLWPYVRPYRGRLFLGMLCGVFCGLSNGVLLLVIKTVVNLVFGKTVSAADELNNLPLIFRPLAQKLAESLPTLKTPSSTTALVLVASAIPAVMLLRSLFGYLNAYLMTWSAARAIANLRTQLFAHLQNLSLSFFSKAKTGDLISRITNDTQVLYGIAGNSLAALVRDPVTIVVLVILLLSQQPLLTGISLVVLPICFGPIIVYGRKVRKSARAMQGHISELTSLMHESFTGNRIIKAYNLEETVLVQFRETMKKYLGHIMRVIRSNEIPSQLTEFLGGVGVALVLIYIGVQTNSAKAGDFLAFVLAIVMIYPSLKSLTKLHNQINQAAAASQRVFELLETSTTVLEPAHPVPLNAKRADIHFHNIEFAYPIRDAAEAEKPVLRNVNLTVKAGQLVALVGSSGSGKTTLTNLLLRFYDPQHGSVRIGGTDIRSVSIKDLRQQIALVAQETILFNDSIRRNIALGRPGATAAEVETAAKLAYAHDFIIEQPLGYETIVGEKGVSLSGGQRQRITIARAILRNAPILVLDEAMNMLDTESERAVQAGLDKLMEGRTTICIAHRLSTIQSADRIVVLDAGRIVETGTHLELMQARGLYCKLYELQFEPAMA
jgi:ATP-binding cassette, subfamily B, bacterial MsbA